MVNKVYTYNFYENPVRLKSVLILLGFIGLGVYAGISEGELSLGYVASGLIAGIASIWISTLIRTSYKLHDDHLTVAISLAGFAFLSENAKYSDITGIEWEPDPPYNIGYNPIGDLESHHYNLGGGHIRIKQENKKDITFSATKEDLDQLKDNLTK